jgi:PAS domain S-box-containing protein
MEAPPGFSQVADPLPDALLLVDGDGLLVDLNPSASRLFGYPRDQLKGQPLARFCASEPNVVLDVIKAGSRSRSLVPGALKIAVAGSEPLDCRCEGCLYSPRSDSEPVLVMLRLSDKKAAGTRFLELNERLVGLVKEVNQRKLAEAELEAVSERLRVTLASIGDAVVSADVQGKVTFTNAVAERLMGLQSPPIGRPLQDVFVIVNETTREPVENPVDKVLRSGDIVGLANHTVLLRPDGSELPIDDSGAPIRNRDGETIGVVMVFRDVSERRQLEIELQKYTRELEESDRRKDEFLSMLAHELRNPLAPLSSSVRLLERLQGGASPQVGRALGTMNRQIGHMTRLVDDLLDVARLKSGSIELRKAPVDLTDVVLQASEMARTVADAGGVDLVVPPVPSLVVDGDATRLVQVVANLLTNAAKFTPAGGTASIRVRDEGGQALLVVRDTGVGIEPALLPRIFDLFVQGDRSLDRASGGLGIGLTVARSIVELHGGTIRAVSEGRGKGAEFVIQLPLLAGGVARAPESPRAAEAAAAPLDILVVDDNVDALDALSSLLEMEGHAVRSAASAAAALQLLNEFQPDAVLLDIGLPGMNGYELARAIRKQAGNRRMLLVAISGYGDSAAKQSSAQAGIDSHLTKPVDFDTLIAVLRTGQADRPAWRHGPPC